MYANNEIGTIQPIKELAQVAHSQGACFHTDAVQAVGHIPIDVNELGVDLLSLSGHKFYGPKGVGALFVRKGTRIKRFLHGGDQEQGRRASTHNVPGIVGIGKAAQLASQRMQEEVKQTLQLRDRLITEIPKRIKEVRLNGHPTQRLPNNVNFGIRYIEGESMLLNLDLLGIAASTGSACTSTSLEPSHVLLAIGVPAEEAHGSLRLTLGRGNTLEDVEYLLEVLPQVVDKLRNMSPLYPPSQ
jgi:cysteine desulfurase